MRSKILCNGTLVVLLLALTFLTTRASDGSFSVPWRVFSSGGADASYASYSLEGSLGQTEIGSSTSTNYGIDSGFWYADSQAQSPAEQKVYLPLVVR